VWRRFHLSGLMNRLFIVAVALSVLVSGYFIPRLFSLLQDEINLNDPDIQTCNQVRVPCKVLIENNEISVYFPDGTDSLVPFVVEVITDYSDVDQVNIKFFMSDMDMGINDFLLDNVSKYKWAGKVILPVCSLSRNDWITEIRLKIRNEVLRVNFKLE